MVTFGSDPETRPVLHLLQGAQQQRVLAFIPLPRAVLISFWPPSPRTLFLVKHTGFPVRRSKYWHLLFWLLKLFRYYYRPCRPQKRNQRLSSTTAQKQLTQYCCCFGFGCFRVGPKNPTCSPFVLGRPPVAGEGIRAYAHMP